MNRRNLLRLGAASAAGLAGGGCRPSGPAVRAGERLLTVWHAWGGVQTPRIQKVAASYERAHPGVKLRLLFTRNDLSTNQKFFTAVAARTPPDITFVDGPQVASWAEQGALEPLSQRIAAAGIRDADYFVPTWRQTVYNGEVWALTYCADPNFGFAWNRKIFRESGLDPDRPPKTIDELNEIWDRLTHAEGGVLRRIAIVPWGQYGQANSMFTWGWAFGGEFYDPASRRITATHPRVVQALEWMSSFAKRVDPARVQAMQQGIGGADQDPFFTGRMVMRCLHIGGLNDVARFAPDLDYGITYIPAPSDGEPRSSWVGGWCAAIPKGCRNPDEAWEFIRYLCHSPEGTSLVGREQGIFPGMRRSPHFDAVRSRPYYGDFVRILEESRHQRPVMPVQSFYMRQLLRAVDAAVYGRAAPAEALEAARKTTQAELDLVLAAA